MNVKSTFMLHSYDHPILLFYLSSFYICKQFRKLVERKLKSFHFDAFSCLYACSNSRIRQQIFMKFRFGQFYYNLSYFGTIYSAKN